MNRIHKRAFEYAKWERISPLLNNLLTVIRPGYTPVNPERGL